MAEIHPKCNENLEEGTLPEQNVQAESCFQGWIQGVEGRKESHPEDSGCHVCRIQLARNGFFFELRIFKPPTAPKFPESSGPYDIQGALKVTNLRGQTERKRRFSLIFTDSCRFSPCPSKQNHLGSADFCRKPLIFAGSRRKPQEPAGNRRLAFVPLGSSP